MRSMLLAVCAVVLLHLTPFPAWADVTVEVSKKGDLVVESDDAGNAFLIHQPLPGSDVFVVTGVPGVSVNGAPEVEVAGVTRTVWIRLGSGQDEVQMMDVVVQRDVDVRDAGGGTFLMLQRVDVARDVHISNGDGGDTVRFMEVSVGGKVDVDNGDGGGYAAPDPSGGAVAGTHIHFSTIEGCVTVRGGLGADYLHVDGSTLGDDLRVDHGDGSGEASGSVGGTTDIVDSTIAGDARVKNGYGRDSLSMRSSSIGGKLQIDNGEGSGGSVGAAGASTYLYASDVGRDLVVKNGYGRDSLYLRTSSVHGDVRVDNGEGSGGLPSADGGLTDVGSSTIDGDLKVQNGFGFDSLGLWRSSVGGHVKIDNGVGGSHTSLYAASVRDVHLKGGEGPDQVYLGPDLHVERNLRIDVGDGMDRVFFGGADVGGSVKVDAGGGDDRVSVQALTVANGFEADGGEGTDEYVESGIVPWPPGSPQLENFEAIALP